MFTTPKSFDCGIYCSTSTSGTDLLICEVVHTLNDYFEKEEHKVNGAEVTETQWWKHISEKFRRIFK
jgi:hypothetical protein